ncbi:MAG: DUF4870 domain-containing protein [Candidatus Eremiobacteraeota bacterium]|nr:DUF4870 domain-containing protein [Candidatus Eremiobacteraeota bacterium]
MIDTQPTQDDKTLAILTHLSGIFFSIIVPLVVLLTSKDTRPWLADQSKEALNFQITVLIGYFVSGALMILLVGFFLFFIVWALSIVLCILAAVRVSQGEPFRYPLTIRLVK